MRIIKLSPIIFPNEYALKKYFDITLEAQDWRFFFPKGHIRDGELVIGETILFSYSGRVRYYAKTKTGKEKNSRRNPNPEPYYFVVDNSFLKLVDTSLTDLQSHPAVNRNLLNQGWNILEEDERISVFLGITTNCEPM